LPAAPASTVEPILITGLRHRAKEERREVVIRFVGSKCSKGTLVLHKRPR
jgi:hypothetical protein